jgi:iron complex outermembrane receptor protein
MSDQPPLVSRNRTNAGVRYRQPLRDALNGVVRLDYQEIGRTWWDPANDISRNPVNLIDLRGLTAAKWLLTAWSKNLANRLYNVEYSPGSLLWRALPRRYGIDVVYHF